MDRTDRLSRAPGPRPPGGTLAPTAVHYRWLAAGLLMLTTYGCLIPLRYRPLSWAEALEAFGRIAYFDPALLEARGDWVISLVQFATLGFLTAGALSVDHRRSVGLAAAALVAPGCVALAVGLEFLQLFFPPRTVSLNDIALESLGGLAGVCVWLMAGPVLTRWCRRLLAAEGLPGLASHALPAYVAILLAVQLMPFDFIIGPDEVARKYREGKVQLVPSASLESFIKAGTNFTAYLPLGVLATLDPRLARAVRGRAGTVLLGLAATATVESLQLLVYSRHSSLADLVTGTAAVVVGRGLARHARPAGVWGVGRIRAAGPGARAVAWWALVGGWLAALALANWQPFDFTADPARFVQDGELTDENTPVVGLRRLALAPLADYYWSNKYNAADQFLKKSLAFAVLGILMAFRPGRRRSPERGLTVLAALAVGLVIEAGQYFIPARHPSTTDVLIGCLGAWVGLSTARHVSAAVRPGPVAPGGEPGAAQASGLPAGAWPRNERRNGTVR